MNAILGRFNKKSTQNAIIVQDANFSYLGLQMEPVSKATKYRRLNTEGWKKLFKTLLLNLRQHSLMCQLMHQSPMETRQLAMIWIFLNAGKTKLI